MKQDQFHCLLFLFGYFEGKRDHLIDKVCMLELSSYIEMFVSSSQMIRF